MIRQSRSMSKTSIQPPVELEVEYYSTKHNFLEYIANQVNNLVWYLGSLYRATKLLYLNILLARYICFVHTQTISIVFMVESNSTWKLRWIYIHHEFGVWKQQNCFRAQRSFLLCSHQLEEDISLLESPEAFLLLREDVFIFECM